MTEPVGYLQYYRDHESDVLEVEFVESKDEDLDGGLYEYAPVVLAASLADVQAEIARLRGALEPHRSGPDFYDWIADRLVHVYGESEGVDFVLTLRRRAQLGREALKDVK